MGLSPELTYVRKDMIFVHSFQVRSFPESSLFTSPWQDVQFSPAARISPIIQPAKIYPLIKHGKISPIVQLGGMSTYRRNHLPD